MLDDFIILEMQNNFGLIGLFVNVFLDVINCFDLGAKLNVNIGYVWKHHFL